MIRVNDRQDPQQGWVEITGAQSVQAPQANRRAFTSPQNEFTSRLATAGANGSRFSVAIGDPDAPEGETADIWYGVVESWQPAGSDIRVLCRPARTIQESAGMLMVMQAGGFARPRLGGAGA